MVARAHDAGDLTAGGVEAARSLHGAARRLWTVAATVPDAREARTERCGPRMRRAPVGPAGQSPRSALGELHAQLQGVDVDGLPGAQ
ncbi:hypothetical protein CAE01nite_19640 [Cellulomonas aerilata]|uniref:Uncharacterized protein n=1 Tax=Cellulomonas aerilata TaxID=515326 RepID=A0A512DCN3_9CELL|nr:hypothetical protein CAE01nite_19640 [Cellulomonas aerilata]